jgi:hypothetical protein
MTTNFFSPLSFFYLFLDPGSEIRDPGWVKIMIRDKHPGSATLGSRFGKVPDLTGSRSITKGILHDFLSYIVNVFWIQYKNFLKFFLIFLKLKESLNFTFTAALNFFFLSCIFLV